MYNIHVWGYPGSYWYWCLARYGYWYALVFKSMTYNIYGWFVLLFWHFLISSNFRKHFLMIFKVIKEIGKICHIFFQKILKVLYRFDQHWAHQNCHALGCHHTNTLNKTYINAYIYMDSAPLMRRGYLLLSTPKPLMDPRSTTPLIIVYTTKMSRIKNYIFEWSLAYASDGCKNE